MSLEQHLGLVTNAPAEETEYRPDAPGSEGPPIRVVLADDHPLIRSGIAHAVKPYQDIEVVAEVGDGSAVLQFLESNPVDVLVLDVHMPHLDGLGCLDQVTARWPQIRVLMLSVEDGTDLMVDALRRGASGFVSKAVRPSDLAAAIRQAASGTVMLGGAPLARAVTRDPEPAGGLLTEREEQVVRLVADGKTNAEIAHQLYISVKTVKFHLTSIFGKLGVSNRTQAALAAGGTRRKPPA